MRSEGRWYSDPAMRSAIVVLSLLAAIDIWGRLLPSSFQNDMPSASSEDQTAFDVVNFLEPSSDWKSWFAQVQLKRDEALEAAQKKLEEEQAAVDDSRVQRDVVPPQNGDVTVLKLNGLDYRLWAVFTRDTTTPQRDIYGVLQGEGGRSLQVRLGDRLGDYEVSEVGERSVQFKSTTDDRFVTLWLFGKGKR